MSRVQYLRTLVVINGLVPLGMLVWDAWTGRLAGNAVNEALHITGIMSLVMLTLSLTMTPLSWLAKWGGWIAFRRALGLFGFLYAVVHMLIYVVWDRSLNLSSTLHEIWNRRFLQIGMLALVVMIPLAITSTNGMIQKLGPLRWKRLHRLAYVALLSGVVHYYMLVKSDVRQPLAFGGIAAVLLGARLVRNYTRLGKPIRGSGIISDQSPAVQAGASGGMAFTSTSPSPAPPTVRARQPWKGELRVESVFQETHDVKTFRLVDPRGGAIPFDYRPGQFVNIQVKVADKAINRSYTIASAPIQTKSIDLTIKRHSHGMASRCMHDGIREGDLLSITGPLGRFTFDGTEAESVLMIAGGVGITPLMSMVRYLASQRWEGRLDLIVVAKSRSDLIFESELDRLMATSSRFHWITTLTRCDEDSLWTGHRGRLTPAILSHVATTLTDLPIYLCGPQEMMNATRRLLLELGASEDNIHTELFGNSKHALSTRRDSVGEPLAPTEAHCQSSDARLSVATPNETQPNVELRGVHAIRFVKSAKSVDTLEQSVLEAAESIGLALPFECRSGYCGQCQVRLLEGEVTMQCEDALSLHDKASGRILACQARPRGSIVIDA